MRITGALVAVLLTLAGCGGSRPAPHAPRRAARAVTRSREVAARAVTRSREVAAAPATGARRRPVVADSPVPVALITAPSENEVLVVRLPTGRVVRRLRIPGEPVYAANLGSGGPVVVVSARTGTVTLLGGDRLARETVLGGLDSPHIPAMFPGSGWAYVTDDASGRVAVVGLSDRKIDASIFVGAGAHHLAFSPTATRVWVALGQAASRIVILSTVVSSPPPPSSPVVDPRRPRVIGHFTPGYLAHDLHFTADGRRVWITAADRPYVGVFSARSRRLLFRVPGGAPPQHVVLAGADAYVTSGYGSRIEQVALDSGRVVRRVWAPYGSFDLDVSGRYVVTSSLFLGTVAVYDRRLNLLHVRRVAPSAEDVSIYRP